MPTRVKKAQVTIFVIIAILIVASVSMLFYLKTQPFAIPTQFKPVEDYFIGCIENKMNDGAALLGSQGGYIALPKFEVGSSYMPFSSQLDFLGTAVPYWFYISGNNIMRQQVPSLQGMEKQLSDFLEEEIKNCDFGEFENRGYKISMGEARISTTINDESIEASITAPLILDKESASAIVGTHKASIKSKIGKFYKIAKKINDKEQKELFLENYSLDTLSLYAPFTNVELSCAPKTWSKKEIERNIKEAVSANIAAIKINGDYYKLKSEENNYFVVQDTDKVNENVNFLFSETWPVKFDVWPSEGDVLKAEPIGTQKGLGILGFCYVQYHFVYDLAYPVMIQIFDNNELFQFPVVVSVSKNKAREGIKTEAVEEVEVELCKYKLTDMKIATINSSANPVEADIKFKCFEQICDIGKTSIDYGEAILNAKVPQCIGGYLVANANGYAESKMQIDTNEPASAEIVLSPLYNLDVEIFVGGAPISKEEQAIITFTSEEDSQTIVYPQTKKIELRDGFYNISAYVYRQGNINLGSYKTQQCTKVPASGIGGFFGFEKEQCYDIELPAQTLTQIVSGGGNTQEYITEGMLSDAKKLSVYTSVMPLPQNILDLQRVYELIDTSEIGIELE
jgi:hypothetical protein